ncbi:hypothetical protein BDV19DRAFT_358334 [Aspergillus venezuelensis]
MKIRPPVFHTLRGLLVIGLSAYAVASPVSLDSLRQKALARSLPGSVAAVPAETVGYQASPATASENPDSSTSSNASMHEDTGDNDEDYESKQQWELQRTQAIFPRSHVHIPSVSEMDAMMMKTETASASKDSMQLLLSFVAFASVSLLHC